VPSADRVLLQTIIDGSAGELETLTELPERLMALRLHTGSIPECVDGGGCLVPRTGDSALICSTPCEESELPALPEAPAMVQLGPCAVGWVSVPPAGPDDIMECVPWVQALECEPGSTQRPGEPCTVVGAACPVGPWPTDLEPGAAYFVDPAAAGGGDGSQPAPYSSIAQVPLSTTATTVIALAKGSHAITTPFVGPVVLQGACALETQISTSLEFTQAPVVLRDVSLVGLRVSGAQVRLQGVIIAVVPQ
jgi:hypothetical protein